MPQRGIARNILPQGEKEGRVHKKQMLLYELFFFSPGTESELINQGRTVKSHLSVAASVFGRLKYIRH